MTREKEQSGTGIQVEERVKVKPPKPYKVILINDDYTPMDFVVSILEVIFGKSPSEAVHIMLQVHNKGQGTCGVYSKEIAEAKVSLVHQRAKQEGHPLRAILEVE